MYWKLRFELAVWTSHNRTDVKRLVAYGRSAEEVLGATQTGLDMAPKIPAKGPRGKPAATCSWVLSRHEGNHRDEGLDLQREAMFSGVEVAAEVLDNLEQLQLVGINAREWFDGAWHCGNCDLTLPTPSDPCPCCDVPGPDVH